MIVKTVSDTDFGLIKQMATDQWYLRKSYTRFRAIEIISHVPNANVFAKYADDLVSTEFDR